MLKKSVILWHLVSFLFLFAESAFVDTNYHFFLVSVIILVHDKIFIIKLIFSMHYQTKTFLYSKDCYPTNKKNSKIVMVHYLQ